jgi:release factor glutamine methyltransferase
MNIKTITKILTDSGIEPNEAKIEAKMLIKSILGLSDIDLIVNEEFSANEELIKKANLRATSRMPIQHIIGTAHFMGENFIVDKNVLIPRDETEILVRKCIEIIKTQNFKSILDIGTGSGCIACSIAKNTEVRVLGTDISDDALFVALNNSAKLELFNKAIFRKSDLFSNIHKDEKFDLIVSNPPYIPETEKGKLQKEVEFDPQEALFAHDEKGVEFYEKIAQKAPQHLNSKGYLLFELGIGQSELVKNIMLESGFCEIEVLKDLAGIDRDICGKLK